MQREWTHLLYKCKVKNTPCENRRPTTHLELNRATTSLICEKSCPLTCPHNCFCSAALDSIFALQPRTFYQKSRLTKDTTHADSFCFNSTCLLLPRAKCLKYVHYEADVKLSKLNTRKHVRQQHCHLSGNLIRRPIFKFSVS